MFFSAHILDLVLSILSTVLDTKSAVDKCYQRGWVCVTDSCTWLIYARALSIRGYHKVQMDLPIDNRLRFYTKSVSFISCKNNDNSRHVYSIHITWLVWSDPIILSTACTRKLSTISCNSECTAPKLRKTCKSVQHSIDQSPHKMTNNNNQRQFAPRKHPASQSPKAKVRPPSLPTRLLTKRIYRLLHAAQCSSRKTHKNNNGLELQ